MPTECKRPDLTCFQCRLPAIGNRNSVLSSSTFSAAPQDSPHFFLRTPHRQGLLPSRCSSWPSVSGRLSRFYTTRVGSDITASQLFVPRLCHLLFLAPLLGRRSLFNACGVDQRQEIFRVKRIEASGLLPRRTQPDVNAPVIGQHHHWQIAQNLLPVGCSQVRILRYGYRVHLAGPLTCLQLQG